MGSCLSSGLQSLRSGPPCSLGPLSGEGAPCRVPESVCPGLEPQPCRCRAHAVLGARTHRDGKAGLPGENPGFVPL